MGCLGNVLWFICGGFLSGLSWCISGCLWCITIVGIPIGMQCFKFAALSFFPFGKEVTYGGGGISFIKYFMDDHLRNSAGSGIRPVRYTDVHYDRRNTIWSAAF
jgi:hypothetical protein